MRSTKLVQENQILQSQTTPHVSSMQDGSSESNATSSPTHDAPHLSRKKSVQGMVTRKSSFGYSRPSRWSGHRVSQRSSLSSNGTRSSMMFNGGASGTNSTFSVPPVPPLPRRRPTDIVTDAPTRSATMISTDGGTPNTEVRAMIRAQDELYRMLGISLGDRRMRRSHSIIGLPGNPETQLHPSSTSMNFLHPPTAVARVSRTDSLDSGSLSNRESRLNTRPQSYPASLLEAYNQLDVDRNAMLATLEMLSQDDS